MSSSSTEGKRTVLIALLVNVGTARAPRRCCASSARDLCRRVECSRFSGKCRVLGDVQWASDGLVLLSARTAERLAHEFVRPWMSTTGVASDATPVSVQVETPRNASPTSRWPACATRRDVIGTRQFAA